MNQFNIQRRTLFLIGTLIVVIVLIAVLALRLQNQQSVSDQKQPTAEYTAYTPSVNPSAILYFKPETVTVQRQKTTPTQVDVYLDAGTHSVSGIQLEMFYDKTAVRNVRINPAENSVLGVLGTDYTTIVNRVDTNTGTITFLAGITPENSLSRGGVGKIATISFSVVPGFTQPSTAITFVNRSAVTELGVAQSVLKSSRPLIIQIQ